MAPCQKTIVFVQKAMLTPWYISKLMVPGHKNIRIIGTVDIQKKKWYYITMVHVQNHNTMP